MSKLRWILLGVALLLLAMGAALTWLLDSPAGARWAAGAAAQLLHGELTIQTVRGTLVGPLEVSRLRYHDPQSGLDVQLERATIDVALRELLVRRVYVENLALDGLTLRLGKATQKQSEPFSLQPPIDVVLERFTLNGAQIDRDGATLLLLRRASLSGGWTSAGIAVRQLDVDSPQGEVHLSGQIGEPEGYVGKLAGRFRWVANDRHYAGRLQATAEGRRATVAVQLSSPVVAQLDGSVEQRDTLPWRFALQVPQFDPRAQLLSGGSLESLAAQLQGAGDRSVAELHGAVTVNGQRVRIEPLRVRWNESALKIEALTLIDPSTLGRLQARGEVRFDPKPFFADLALQWQRISLPKEWVGQKLVTQGALQLRGNPSTFNAAGKLALGPPKRLADVTLALNGTPQAIELQRLEIVEPGARSIRPGRLDAHGHIQLKPALGWQIAAQATGFDPGTFIAGWPGRLNLTLASQGKLESAGPRATLEMSRLDGTLRQRAVSGRASLNLAPDKVVAGTLRVRSGASTLQLKGERGKSMNLLAQLDVATLDDWLPQSRGQLNARFQVTGIWPKLHIEGGAHGSKLALADSAVDSVTLKVDVHNPLDPAGTLEASAQDLHAGGFAFTSIALQASGDQRQHTAALVATGEPLSGELRITGSRQSRAWSGTIEQLRLSATHIAKLALAEPARITLSEQGFTISKSCLAGDGVSLCLAAERDQAGTLQGSYTIEHLPLALIAAVAQPNLGFQLSGTIEGHGSVRRTPDGALFGDAHLESGSGSVRETGEATEALLSYANFKADAVLQGDTARMSTAMTFTPRGALHAEASFSGLRGRMPSLNGSAELTLDDLAPAALFVPQLADVSGRAQARAAFTGPLKSPSITGSAQVLAFAAEVPAVGLKLHDGELQAALRAANQISLAGHLASGDGRIELQGTTSHDGILRVKISGANFLAADIPAARVTITPDVEFTRSSEQMDLRGTVRVPSAHIDATKLPQGGPRQPSPDVIVVDDEALEQSRKTPLYATITVILGDDVKLVGFGLDATLAGQLVVHEAPGEETIGSGEIRVAGTYKAYGQDLTIEQGRLLFAATPLKNPQVNLIAVRTLPEATIRLTVTGSAQRPLLSVSSDTGMSQTEALSYLVTGKPLNQLGTGEGDLVQSAARSLGGAAGNLLAKNLGKRIGVDEIAIENSTEIGGSAFTVGQYLSPRLYLSYGVGLFEPGQVVTLRYRISDKVSLEASQGPLNQRAGVTYKVEK